MPMISIIVPVYRVEEYLSQCIESILAQTFTDFELLLIDDGSPDRSGEICNEYARKDSRVRVFHKENGGVSTARNLGINNARGEWIYFSDSDDELPPDGLSILVAHLSEDVDFVMGGYEVYDYDNTLCLSLDEDVTQQLSPEECIALMFGGRYYQGYLVTKLFRRAVVIDKNLRLDQSIHFNEDRLFSVAYLSAIERKCVYTHKSVYKYYKRPTSAMASLQLGFNRKFVTDFEAFQKMVHILKENGSPNVVAARKGLYQSFRTITNMMKRADSFDWSLYWKLKKTVFSELPISELVRCYTPIYKSYVVAVLRKLKLRR